MDSDPYENIQNLDIKIQVFDNSNSVKIYIINVKFDSIVMNIKRSLVKCIAKENGLSYTSGHMMDNDAQKYGLVIENNSNQTILKHSHLLLEYKDLITSPNTVINAIFRKDICDNCWRTEYKCQHLEGFYPDGLECLYEMEPDKSYSSESH
jgi:hypothetical protein